ncbi:YceI family protein [Saccharopolyspora sp. ASAGF58]|uniref:YceI family protein n=1 Tax=Saccharopolyspora TaxID=1835 RepID=UPI0014402CBA|nr:YceI family protein [Saccharopolyspora sp. ASAGF58]QIZ37247.1 YceI family protein [Saccharopolyspora sp. ASAGF58]
MRRTGLAQRDERLRSNDFFDMASFPELSFRSITVERVDETIFKVTGHLTVKGVTRPIILDVE